MTASTHVYRAWLTGPPETELSVLGGSLTLDAGTAPHVQGELTVSMPRSWADGEGGSFPGDGVFPGGGVFPGLLYPSSELPAETSIDPRQNSRVRLEVDGTYPSFSVHREFDLHLRDRAFDQSAGTVRLTLASDEGLLSDYAPLADDDAPWALQGSVRDIVDYVLGKAILGAALEPGTDADLTSYWDVQTLLLNGSAGGSIAPWTAAGNCTLFHATIGRTGGYSVGFASAGAGILALTPTTLSGYISVTAGRAYTLSAYARRANLPPGSSVQAVIRWITDQDFTPWGDVLGPATVINDTDWNPRAVLTATAPAGAVKAFVYFRVTGATAASQIGYLDDAMFHEGVAADAFDGATPDTPYYLYDWDGTAYASTARRTALVDSPQPDAFIWRAGQTALDFLHPLVQVSGLRLVCDEQRNWTLRDEEYTATGSVSIRHAVNMIDGSDSISRDSGLWFDAAVTTYTWTDTTGAQQKRIDSYALVTPHTRLKTFEKSTPYPGPGFSEYAVRRAQGRGREVTATSVADWRANAEQNATIVLEGAPIQTGKTQRVRFDLDTDRMTPTLRTTDTPALAWVLGPFDKTWADVTPTLTWNAMNDWSDA